jgi:hypothetical protein
LLGRKQHAIKHFAIMKFTSHLLTASSVYFGFPVLAQNNSSSSDSQCPPIIEDLTQGDVAFNATGTTALSLPEQDAWHLSLTFQFRLARDTSTVKDASSWGRPNRVS